MSTPTSSAAIPDLKRGVSLDAPPRRISPLLWLQVTFGRFHCGFGAAFSFPVLAMPFMIGEAPLPAMVIGVFPFVGAVMFISGMRKGLRGVRLLGEGRLGFGALVDETKTSTQINKVDVMELRFRFVDDTGSERFVVARTHLTAPLRDQAEEPLLYERGDDGEAMMLDDLPGHPRIVEGKLAIGDRRSLATALFSVAVMLLLTVLATVASLVMLA